LKRRRSESNWSGEPPHDPRRRQDRRRHRRCVGVCRGAGAGGCKHAATARGALMKTTRSKLPRSKFTVAPRRRGGVARGHGRPRRQDVGQRRAPGEFSGAVGETKYISDCADDPQNLDRSPSKGHTPHRQNPSLSALADEWGMDWACKTYTIDFTKIFTITACLGQAHKLPW
jgi:hypothetical protein